MSEMPSSSRIAERARDWWQDLQPTKTNGEPNQTGDRAALARLRRAASPAEVLSEEATLALFRRLGLRGEDYLRLPRVALIAMVLAHVRADTEPRSGWLPARCRSCRRPHLGGGRRIGQDEPASPSPSAGLP